jgi:hypothetical protein
VFRTDFVHHVERYSENSTDGELRASELTRAIVSFQIPEVTENTLAAVWALVMKTYWMAILNYDFRGIGCHLDDTEPE